MAEITKKCTKCGEEKPLSAFDKYHNCKHGVNSQCRECLSPGYNERRKREAKEDRLFEQGKMICSKCDQIKSLDNFRKTNNGRYKIRKTCNECEAEKRLEYNMKKNPAFYKELKRKKELLKQGKKECVNCKQIKPLEYFGKNNASGKSKATVRYKRGLLDGYQSWCLECSCPGYDERKKQREYDEIIYQQGYKKCTSCGRYKPFSYYQKVTANKDGMQIYCNECRHPGYTKNRWMKRQKEKQKDRGYIKCLKCEDVKPLSEYYEYWKGSGKYHCYCRECIYPGLSEKQKKRRRKRKIARELLGQGKKKCIECKQIKTIDNYWNENGTPDGYNRKCIECLLPGHNERKQQQELIDLLLNIGYKKCSRCNEIKELDDYYNNTYTTFGKSSWCKDCTNQDNKRWQEDNYEKVIAMQQRRRAREIKAPGHYTADEFIDLCKKYDNRCVCCGKKKKLTVDHVIPISKGGSNYIENIQPLCQRCNSSKHTKRTDYRADFHERWQLRLF